MASIGHNASVSTGDHRFVREEPIVRPRMPELDVVRGIAILAVLIFHGCGDSLYYHVQRPLWQQVIMAMAAQGWAGVNLFFVLSGFLITGILLDSAPQSGYYSQFYIRRALRILPVYYLALLIVLIWRYGSGTRAETVWAFAGLSFIYLSNVSALFGVDFLYPLLWSLSVEEHFYLVWPALVRRLGRRSLALLAILICTVEPALRYYDLSHGGKLWWAGSHHGGSYVYTWMMADGLALGALLALLVRSRVGTRRNLARIAGATFAVSLVLTALSVVVSKPLGFCIRGTVVNYFALAIIAASLWMGTGARRHWINIRPLMFYGYISYGLYLFHELVNNLYGYVLVHLAPRLLSAFEFGKIWLFIVVSTAFATAVAYLSRITYEEFFLRMKPRRRAFAAERSATSAA